MPDPAPPALDEAALARLERAMTACSPLQMTVYPITVSSLRVDLQTVARVEDAAELISAAVNAAPALCAELRETRALAARMRAALAGVVSAVLELDDPAFRAALVE